jgi:tetratricopeptide (TPR) repeat protein
MRIRRVSLMFLSVGFLGMGQHLMAQDLESLLSEAAKEPAKKNAEAMADSRLARSLKTLLLKTNSEQNVFLRHVEAQAWNKALLQFPSAFEGTQFQKSSNGRALLALMQLKAGLTLTGVETLFQMADPKEMDSELKREWKEALPPGHFAWNLAQIQWAPGWSVVFGPEPGFHLMAREIETVQNIKKLQELSEKVPSESAVQAEVDWQLLLAMSQNDQTAEAGKLLARLMKSSQAPVSQDLLQITAGRLLYQNGYFDTAIKMYEKVPKKSEYWAEAQEEMAWAYIRKGEPQNAMAITQSLVASVMVNQVSPESSFVPSLSQLKVCDYTGVVSSLGQFSKNFKSRTVDLDSLAKTGTSPEAVQVIDQLKTGKAGIKDVGAAARKLPRLISRDEKIFRLAQAQKHFENEAQAAEALYAQSLAQTGLQGQFDGIKKITAQKAQRARSASLQRIQELAQTEVLETRDVLRKMHIIEAEVLQQVSAAERVAKNTVAGEEKAGSTGSKARDVLKFPVEQELWFDEISNYKVDIKKACHAKR